jgi:hypothetical protein
VGQGNPARARPREGGFIASLGIALALPLRITRDME